VREEEDSGGRMCVITFFLSLLFLILLHVYVMMLLYVVRKQTFVWFVSFVFFTNLEKEMELFSSVDCIGRVNQRKKYFQYQSNNFNHRKFSIVVFLFIFSFSYCCITKKKLKITKKISKTAKEFLSFFKWMLIKIDFHLVSLRKYSLLINSSLIVNNTQWNNLFRCLRNILNKMMLYNKQNYQAFFIEIQHLM